MSDRLEMCDEAWSSLMDDAVGLRNLAYAVRGLVPNHLWSRLDYLADDIERILKDGVEVVDEDHPDLERKINGLEYAAEAAMERSHVNLDADPAKQIENAYDDWLESEREKEEEKA